MRLTFAWLTLVWVGYVSAQDIPGNAATTIQLPTFGVSVDAHGELTVKSFPDPTGRLKAQRLAASRSRLSGEMAARSELRKVSLVALERAVAKCLETGAPIDESLQYLAGMQRIRYVFLYPSANDVVIAGPAEGWVDDASGRVVGITTGRPVLRLDDLSTALRVYARGPRQTFLGCTIDPPPEGLERLRRFQKKMPNVVGENQRGAVAQFAVQGTRSALGMAEVRLFGVPTTTHFAQVLVEADYRMKCIAIGLEPPPVPMKTYLGSLRGVPGNSLQRWWFTPNYQCVRVTDDGLAMEMVGQGVQLQTEDRTIDIGGKLSASTGKSHPAATAYAKSFTEQYPAIAAASPVYAELRNIIDMAISAAWLERAGASAGSDWKAQLLRDEKQYAIETFAAPKKVACVANVVWSGNRMLVPAGGGVSISPEEALKPENLLPADPELSHRHSAIQASLATDRWWWD
jgi:hypothetical protein